MRLYILGMPISIDFRLELNEGEAKLGMNPSTTPATAIITAKAYDDNGTQLGGELKSTLNQQAMHVVDVPPNLINKAGIYTLVVTARLEEGTKEFAVPFAVGKPGQFNIHEVSAGIATDKRKVRRGL